MNVSTYSLRYKRGLVQLMKSTEISEDRALSIIRRYDNHHARTLFLAHHEKKLLGYCAVAANSSHRIGEMILGDILLSHAHLVDICSVTKESNHIQSSLLLIAKSWAKEKGKQGVWLSCSSDEKKFYLDNGFYEDSEYHPEGWTDDKSDRLYFLVTGPRQTN